jgi:hypothetical protein
MITQAEKVQGWANRKSVRALVILTALCGWVHASFENGAYSGEMYYVVADEDGTSRFVTTDTAARYLVIGFDSEPVLLEVSDENEPKWVTGFTSIETVEDQGAYLESDVASSFVATGINEIFEVTTISQP